MVLAHNRADCTDRLLVNLGCDAKRLAIELTFLVKVDGD
jgi:hypothetical protein